MIRIATSAAVALWGTWVVAGPGLAGEATQPSPASQPLGAATPPATSAPSQPVPVQAAPVQIAPVPPPPAVTATKPGTPALVLDTDDYEGLLGKGVRAVNGDDLGRLIDVIVDKEGRPRAAIIDFGGFLGVGSRKIAVDWRVLKFGTPDGKTGPVTLQLSRNQVRVSPEYKSGEPIVVLGAASPGAPAPEGDQAAAPAPATPERPQGQPSEKPSERAPE